MTTVERAITYAPAPAARPRLARPTKTAGWTSWFTTIDHKKIGILYIVTALVFFCVGGSEALLIRVQLWEPNGTVLTAAMYNQLFTMHGTTMIFLLGMPMAVGLGNYLVPLMIGARDVAFPRINMLGYWIFLFGGLFIYSSFLLGGAPNGGWFGYTPLTSMPYANGYLPSHGADFWAVGLIMLGIGSVTSGLNFIVTILNMRAPGMTLLRMPVFVWMILVIAVLTVFAMPTVTAALIQVYMDRNFHTNFFNATNGGDPLLYQNLFWIFGHPEVYILILPGMGIVSEILPVFSRKPLFGARVVVFSGIAIGFLGWGVWAHHMFVTGIGPAATTGFGIATMAIAVPTGVKIFNWLGTVWGGAVRLKTPMLFALGFIAMFTIGGLSGVLHSIVPSDAQQTDTYFVVAHFHYVLFGGLVFAIFGGLYYWWPKMFGHMLSDGIGKLNFWSMLIGFNLTFFPMHIVGLEGMPRRTYTYGTGFGWDIYNKLETVGAFIIALSVLIFIVNVFVSRANRQPVEGDPWDARTLEWSIPSPAPAYNFLEIPEVHAFDDFWHKKYTEDEEGRLVRLPSGGSDAGEHDIEVAASHIHLPSPSYWPLVFALGMPIMGYGFVYKNWWILGVGVFVAMFGLSAWTFEPSTAEEEH
ncbi:MAG TPA: cytochrome c oxidase subunit I [Acidimicrobiia bacterium]